LAESTEAIDARWAAFSQPGWRAATNDEVEEEESRKTSERPIVVILALKQRNLEFLEQRARRVTDPVDSLYGQYYTRDEVNSIAGPEEEHIRVVKEFLETSPGGVSQFSRGGDLASFTCKVKCVEELFNTTLVAQRGITKPGDSPFRAGTPICLPDKVAEALDGVSLNAPLFMPARPKQALREKFEFPAVGRNAPRIHPRLISGDQFVSLRFVAYCQDGRANQDTLAAGVCSSRGGYGSKNWKHGGLIVSFEIVVIQQPAMQKVMEIPASSDVLGQSKGLCAEGVACMEFNATIGAIQNYAETSVRIRAHFADGTVSSFSPASEVPPTWPLPYTTPQLLATAYGIPINHPIRSSRNIIAVAEFLGQYYNPADLETFFRLMGVRSWEGEGRTQPQVIGNNKPEAGSVLGGEAQLDLQYMMALAPNVTTVFWSVPGIELGTTQEPFLDWLMQVSDSEDERTPLVHSVSYADDERPMPMWFKTRVNQEFMKFALRGISILVASGDDGVSGSGARTNRQACSSAMPMFPASSPWVTAVGGTMLAKAASPVCQYTSTSVVVSCHVDGEVSCDSSKGGGITSGGGFSEDFARPWYQEEAVEEYLQQNDNPLPSPQGNWTYNPKGRAYPDLSGVASNYLVWMGDHLQPTSGTSASTPLLAAVVALLNEDRLSRNLPVLGFLNPLLYRLASGHPEAFNDVVMGNNKCSAGSICCDTGFGAARGWDAVTGWGSPNFKVMQQILKPQEEMRPRLFGPSFTALAEAAAVAEEGEHRLRHSHTYTVSGNSLLSNCLLVFCSAATTLGMFVCWTKRRSRMIRQAVLDGHYLPSSLDVSLL